MLLDGQRLLRAQPLAGDVRPAEGQRHERQQLLQPLGLGDVCGFEAEAARLQAPEQGLDLPPAGVVFERRLRLALRDDDQVLAPRQPHPRDVPPLAPEQACPAQHLCLPDAAVAEQPARRDPQPAPIRDLRVSADADAAGDTFAAQVMEPVLANKLPVGAQVGDRGEAEQPPELVEERDAFGGRGAALLRQDDPQQGEGRALMHDAEDEDVQRCLTQIPVGAVERERPRTRHAEQPQDEGGDARVGQLEGAQEALDALVVRPLERAPGEDAGHLREVNTPDLDEGDEELGHEVDARTVPRYIPLQRPLQQADVGHCAFPFHVSFGDGR